MTLLALSVECNRWILGAWKSVVGFEEESGKLGDKFVFVRIEYYVRFELIGEGVCFLNQILRYVGYHRVWLWINGFDIADG